MLLCASAITLGCRYYIGDWDAKAEQFVPQSHGRMNFIARDEQSLFGRPPWRVDFFDGRTRACINYPDGRRQPCGAGLRRSASPMARRMAEPSNPYGVTRAGPPMRIPRIKPLRELETLRHDRLSPCCDVTMSERTKDLLGTQRYSHLQKDLGRLLRTVTTSQLRSTILTQFQADLKLLWLQTMFAQPAEVPEFRSCYMTETCDAACRHHRGIRSPSPTFPSAKTWSRASPSTTSIHRAKFIRQRPTSLWSRPHAGPKTASPT